MQLRAKETTLQLADALTLFEAREDEERITVRAGRALLEIQACNAAKTKKNLLSAHRSTRHAYKTKGLGRTFPKFHAGMSTDEYVKLFAAYNPGFSVHLLPFAPGSLNTKPATLYEGGAVDFDVIVEIEADEEIAGLDLV